MSVFSYPVEITMEEIKNECGFDLVQDYGTNGMRVFLNAVHSAVYDGCIYATGDKDIKDRIILAHRDKTEPSIKKALLLQAMYMNEQGNIATESGIHAEIALHCIDKGVNLIIEKPMAYKMEYVKIRK